MANNFVLNSLLSVFLDDYHEIPSDLDIASLSQKDIDLHINRIPTPTQVHIRLLQKLSMLSLNRLM